MTGDRSPRRNVATSALAVAAGLAAATWRGGIAWAILAAATFVLLFGAALVKRGVARRQHAVLLMVGSDATAIVAACLVWLLAGQTVVAVGLVSVGLTIVLVECAVLFHLRRVSGIARPD